MFATTYSRRNCSAFLAFTKLGVNFDDAGSDETPEDLGGSEDIESRLLFRPFPVALPCPSGGFKRPVLVVGADDVERSPVSCFIKGGGGMDGPTLVFINFADDMGFIFPIRRDCPVAVGLVEAAGLGFSDASC